MSKTILIVEDDANILKLLKYNLEKAGFECNTCITGESALDFLEKYNADLVVLDVMLPKMDGYKVCALLKKDARYSKIPIILFTARAQEDDKQLGTEVGADAYLTKPFEPDSLLLKIEELLRKGD